MGVIYKITSPSNRVYIGKTKDLRKRINCHKHSSMRYGKNILLYNSIRKYGWDAHVLEVIEEVENCHLNEREVYWINELKTYCHKNKGGLNMTIGGDGNKGSWMHNIELRGQMSKMFSGGGNPFYGKTHTEATRKIISEKATIRQKKSGHTVPYWGTLKGRLQKIRPVLLYDVSGILIKEFESQTECAKYIGSDVGNVTDALKRSGWMMGRYKVIRKGQEVVSKIEVGSPQVQNVKRPVLWLSDEFEIIVEYPSAKEASDFWSIPETSINRNARDIGYLRTGHNFLYKDLYETLMVA